jgi:hypothetical protein
VAKTEFHQQLLGRIVRPNPTYFQSDNSQFIWPFNPNMNNELLATIEGCWIDDGHVRLALRGPDGKINDKIYLSWVLLS